MKQAYKFLTKHLFYFLLCAIACAGTGSLAMYLGYNSTTSWLQVSGACTILFAIIILATIAYAIFIAVKLPSCRIARIKKKYTFLKITSILGFVLLFFMFLRETWTLILATYQDAQETFFSTWRFLKYAASLPASVYFLFMALPSRTRRRKRIEIPKLLQYITTVGVIAWGVFGLLAAYFYDIMSFKNILKIWQLLIYLAFIVFFLFEAKFIHLNDGKRTHRGYIFTGLLSFIVAMAFSLSTTISMIFRIVPTDTGISFSAVEVFTSFAIGLYALSRIYGYVNTLRAIVYNSDTPSSSKFHGHHHHSHHHHHSSNDTDTVEIDAVKASDADTAEENA